MDVLDSSNHPKITLKDGPSVEFWWYLRAVEYRLTESLEIGPERRVTRLAILSKRFNSLLPRVYKMDQVQLDLNRFMFRASPIEPYRKRLDYNLVGIYQATDLRMFCIMFKVLYLRYARNIEFKTYNGVRVPNATLNEVFNIINGRTALFFSFYATDIFDRFYLPINYIYWSFMCVLVRVKTRLTSVKCPVKLVKFFDGCHLKSLTIENPLYDDYFQPVMTIDTQEFHQFPLAAFVEGRLLKHPKAKLLNLIITNEVGLPLDEYKLAFTEVKRCFPALEHLLITQETRITKNDQNSANDPPSSNPPFGRRLDQLLLSIDSLANRELFVEDITVNVRIEFAISSDKNQAFITSYLKENLKSLGAQSTVQNEYKLRRSTVKINII